MTIKRIKNYESGRVYKDILGDADPKELESLIDKKIKRIENFEGSIKIILSNNKFIEAIAPIVQIRTGKIQKRREK